MKHRRLIILLFIFLNLLKINSQDFEFLWEITPFARKAYTVRINQIKNRSTIMIKESYSNDSVVKRIKTNDCDTLIDFLNNYNFPIKGSTIYGSVFKKYIDIVMLPDTNWIIFKGDSIRKVAINWPEYKFDTDSNKYYTEGQMIQTWTDGNTYEGYFLSNNGKRKYKIYCARIDKKDFELNQLVYKLITMYDKKNTYLQLKEVIDADKPQ